jgi:SAM-dependent methyltransferase
MINKSIKEYFFQRYRKYGNNIQSLWGSTSSQEDRFQILSDIGDLNRKTILDVGCGFGDLYRYLNSKGIHVGSYHGVDLVEEFILEATLRHQNPESRATFEISDILETRTNDRFDFAFASGLFFMRNENWDSYVSSVCEKMFSISRVGVAVNFLSEFSTAKDGFSKYSCPTRVLNLLMNAITSKAVLRHDYRRNDFTIYLYH